MGAAISIQKADGTLEPFVPEKLRRSLAHAGASVKTADNITLHLEREISEGMTTDAIYKHAFDILKKSERVAANRYSMKRAVQELGPSGFPFEDFLAEIFRAKGYTVTTREVLRGSCVSHEVDIVAYTPQVAIGGEAKFHNDLGIKTDVRVALYVHARFDDLKTHVLERARRSISEFWLLTNTKFTTEAIEYGRCVGLSMISWNYPTRGNLADLVEETAIFPVTCLTTLTRGERRALIAGGVVLCRDILRRPDTLASLGLSQGKIKSVLAETRNLCEISHTVQ